MAFAIELSDEQWDLVSDLFDPPGRRGAPALIARSEMENDHWLAPLRRTADATIREEPRDGHPHDPP